MMRVPKVPSVTRSDARIASLLRSSRNPQHFALSEFAYANSYVLSVGRANKSSGLKCWGAHGR